MKAYTLDYTGERHLPWSGDYRTAYEHVHRYLVACRYVTNKRVLDISCGEGYGTVMLASVATAVLAVDNDAPTLRHAQTYHKHANVQFVQADAQHFNCAPGSIDVVVSLETIEHFVCQESFLNAMKSALTPDGILIISTPNRYVYHEFADEMNPFHVRELERDDFVTLLKQRFRNVQLFGQKMTSDSLIAPVVDDRLTLHDGDCEIVATAVDATNIDYPICPDGVLSPRYFIAICSDHPLPQIMSSVMVDVKEALSRSETQALRDAQQTLDTQAAEIATLSAKVDFLSQNVQDSARTALINQAEIVRQASDLRKCQAAERYLKSVIAENEQTIEKLRGEIEARSQHIDYQIRYIERQHALVDEQERKTNTVYGDLLKLRAALDRIEQSMPCCVYLGLRKTLKGIAKMGRD